MKVFIAGGSGRVATQVCCILAGKGNEILAGSRDPGKVVKLDGVIPVAFDLHASVDKIAGQINGCDAIYFLAGSRGKDLLQTDAFGAVKLMQAAERDGIRRFIMLSSIFSLEPGRWSEEKSLAGIMNYNIAKFFADNWLINNTNLVYTIVQPSSLTAESGTGMIEIDPAHDGTNPIPDVAQVLADVLDLPNTYRKVIMLHSGNVSIADALAAV